MVSGLVADSRVLVEGARSEALYYRFVYKDSIPIKALTQSVADQALNFGEGDITVNRKPNARPYGVSLLFAGIDNKKPIMYHTDPSGTIIGYLAKGLGSAEEGIQSLLEKHYNTDLNIEEGKKLSISILKQVMEDKIKSDIVDLYSMSIDDKTFKKHSKEEIEIILTNLPSLD